MAVNSSGPMFATAGGGVERTDELELISPRMLEASDSLFDELKDGTMDLQVRREGERTMGRPGSKGELARVELNSRSDQTRRARGEEETYEKIRHGRARFCSHKQHPDSSSALFAGQREEGADEPRLSLLPPSSAPKQEESDRPSRSAPTLYSQQAGTDPSSSA